MRFCSFQGKKTPGCIQEGDDAKFDEVRAQNDTIVRDRKILSDANC